MYKVLILCSLSFLALAGDKDVQALAQQVRDFRVQHEQQIVDDFVDLLKIPNVASDQANIQRNASHIRALFEARDFDMRLLWVGRDKPPVVYGERLTPGATITVMLYVHYDGQPVQAANWSSPPWQPVLRKEWDGSTGIDVPIAAPFDPESRLFARSAGDDKAPIVAMMYAIDALDRIGLKPSINLKLFFEGEEEAGSPNLKSMLEQHRDLLEADLWVFCDGPMHPSGRLQMAYGVRGTQGFDLSVYGPMRPLHSGHYGNWAPNPIAMLSALLTSMRAASGDVLIDGFYDEVLEPSPSELKAIERIPKADLALKYQLGLKRTEGAHRVEREILKPALNFRGVKAGEVGDQARNIILPVAQASVGIRLVPGQTMAHLQTVVERHIQSQGYQIVRVEPDRDTRLAHDKIVRVNWGNNGYPAYRTPLDHPMAEGLAALLRAYTNDHLIQAPTMGGSLPLYLIKQVLGAPVIILPIANHDNNQHGKDENLRLQNLWDAIEIYAITLVELGHRISAAN